MLQHRKRSSCRRHFPRSNNRLHPASPSVSGESARNPRLSFETGRRRRSASPPRNVAYRFSINGSGLPHRAPACIVIGPIGKRLQGSESGSITPIALLHPVANGTRGLLTAVLLRGPGRAGLPTVAGDIRSSGAAWAQVRMPACTMAWKPLQRCSVRPRVRSAGYATAVTVERSPPSSAGLKSHSSSFRR